IFSVVTISNYFKNREVSKKIHEDNIYKSITFIAMMNTVDYMLDKITFEHLLEFTNLNASAINYTTVDILKSDGPSLEQIIPNISEDFCMIFLKNTKFFVIIGDNNSKTYHVR